MEEQEEDLSIAAAEEEEEETIAAAVTALLMRYSSSAASQSSNRLGRTTVKRERLDVEAACNALTDKAFRRMYRMKKDAFVDLLAILESSWEGPLGKRKRGATPNGDITRAARLSMALRFCAGGDKFDIAFAHGVNENEVYKSVWIVVDAIHQCEALDIKFPEDKESQEEIALGFKEKSACDFSNCAACVDGMLVWTNKPTEQHEDLDIGPAKFYCGRKKKFGINMQGVCDHKKRFLDVVLGHPGSASDFTVWQMCSLRDRMEAGLLSQGLVIYADNAYINTPYMATPFKNVSSGAKDDFNFYHSQLRITVEGAFGMLVNRWGCLRKPMPVNFRVSRINKLVYALCKLHNFCIDSKETELPLATTEDSINIMLEGGVVGMDREALNHFIGGGHTMEDIPVEERRARSQAPDTSKLPVYYMLKYIEDGGYKRPAPQTPRSRT